MKTIMLRVVFINELSATHLLVDISIRRTCRITLDDATTTKSDGPNGFGVCVYMCVCSTVYVNIAALRVSYLYPVRAFLSFSFFLSLAINVMN